MKNSFKSNPSFYYSMSIAATWAGAGSFIVGTQIAQTVGIFPWLLWALGNVLCCIVFGMLADSFPKLRAVAMSKPVQYLMGLMCVFQIWVNMNGIYEMLSPTIIGTIWLSDGHVHPCALSALRKQVLEDASLCRRSVMSASRSMTNCVQATLRGGRAVVKMSVRILLTK